MKILKVATTNSKSMNDKKFYLSKKKIYISETNSKTIIITLGNFEWQTVIFSQLNGKLIWFIITTFRNTIYKVLIIFGSPKMINKQAYINQQH